MRHRNIANPELSNLIISIDRSLAILRFVIIFDLVVQIDIILKLAIE